MAYPELAWGRWSAGVEERGMQARVAQEPGRSRFLHLSRRCGRRGISGPGPGGCSIPGSETGQRVVAPSEGNEARRDGRREVGVH